ncbi:MAG: hypothetical protein JW959_04105 [Pirellulales bacterium]|nr:hypothetical protein [Pirellulales bacterium]
MADTKRISPEQHRGQIEKYCAELPRYEAYAESLRRVLERACKAVYPDALVQSRPKSVSSFAEKAVRKFDKYPDAVNQMTDLCGARVIVQTTDQVEAVKKFIENVFLVVEDDEKGVLLGEDKFGYRDMHYIVQIPAEYREALGITADERERIGDRKAEIQVRTWLQHAWADTLHDRLYKNPLRLSSEIKRTGNLLAALMEEGDRNYNVLAHELDEMLANYTAFAPKEAVAAEIAAQELILANEPDDRKKPALALKLARLSAAAGDFARVVEALSPHRDIDGANRAELIGDLGCALCKVRRQESDSAEYKDGLGLLERAVELCGGEDWSHVPDLCKREGLHARSLARLAWALEPIRREGHRARELYRQAHEHEPANPYYLADMLGFEVYFSRNDKLSSAMRTTLREALKTCRRHAEAGIELPRAYFTAGRLCLLLDRPLDALGYYARGLHHYLAGAHCTPADALSREVEWVENLHVGERPPDGQRWMLELLELAEQSGNRGGAPADVPKAVVLAGGAASLDQELPAKIRPLIEGTLRSFTGAVIAGGTTMGVPGCAGEAARSLGNAKKFKLVGYIPKRLPHDAPKDERYDEIRVFGDSGFSPDQILQSWRDLFADGIAANEVLCIGIGGGPLSAVEYRVAMALGARVVVAHGSGGAADEIAADPLWAGMQALMPAPIDPATFHALLASGQDGLDPEKVTEMAQEFHRRYVEGSAGRLPENMRPWPKLGETYRKANLEQAGYAANILEACGFGVRSAEEPVVFDDFSDEEVERMAEMEHGRWNVERLRHGWRPGKPRNDALRIHDCILPWDQLSDAVRKHDYDAVRAFPAILAKAGLEVYKP